MKKIINNTIITNIVILAIILSLTSCTNSSNEITLDNINSETENINNMIDSGSVIWISETWTSSSLTNEKVVKLESTYLSPGWENDVNFEIKTDKNWVITNVFCYIIEADKTSINYISWFNNIVDSVIKWKTIEEAKEISTVWGASLTTNAFKNAISKI